MILRATYDGTGGGVSEDKRFYYAQNWRADVSVVLDDAGVQQERVMYSPYGQPFAMPAGDTNFDGDFEAGVDGDELADWDINGVPYRAYADVNLDGDIDGADAAAASEHDLGWNVLTSGDVESRIGRAGSVQDRDVVQFHVLRAPVYSNLLGRSLQRTGGILDGGSGEVETCYDPCGCPAGDAKTCPGAPGGGSGPSGPTFQPGPPSPWPTPKDNCAGTTLTFCLLTSPEVRRALDYWRRTCGPAGKGELEIECDGNQCPGPDGYYCCGSRRIHLCKPLDCPTLAHELIHAGDMCSGAICRILPLPGQCGGFLCKDSACSEARAFAYDGICCNSPSQADFESCIEGILRRSYSKQYRFCCGDPIGYAIANCVPPQADACGGAAPIPWPRMGDTTSTCGGIVTD